MNRHPSATPPASILFRVSITLLLLTGQLIAGPAEDQIAAFQRPKDVQVQVFASDEQLNNPVAICLDPKGRLFAAESLRQQAGVYGTAGGQKFWTMDDYTTTNLEQRRAMYVK